jgi:2'-5' RNA ligase
MTNDGAKPVRAFIAITLPDWMITQVETLQNSLRSRLEHESLSATVRWVRPQQAHLTLRFLGDIAPDTVRDLETALARACQGIGALQLHAEGIGCFPHTRNPRVIWMGIGGELERLHELQARIEHEVGPLCEYSESGSFHPHLTLARLKSTKRQEARRIGSIIESTNVAPLDDWTVQRIVLMRSELSSRGSTYSELSFIPLTR